MKLARIQKDLSQEQLAEVVGVTRQTIGLIEAGNYNPTLKLCIAICKALDRSLNDIFGRNKIERVKGGFHYIFRWDYMDAVVHY